jgi:hypothetical protein
VPAARTEITEIVTGLAMFGDPDLAAALERRPPELRHVATEHWDRLAALAEDPAQRDAFAAAWGNGRAFLHSPEGLRGRPPLVVEWTGLRRVPAEDAVPADLRVDHVYLISCKYLSRILVNTSPGNLFDHALRRTGRAASGDWFGDVATEPYQALYAVVRDEVFGDLHLPPFVRDLNAEHRAALRGAVIGAWSPRANAAYREFAAAVATASAARWRVVLARKADRESMLWRLLRIGGAPYFVLGVADQRPLRIRVGTPWDWRQAFDLRSLDVWGEAGGQPLVRWRAEVRDRLTGEQRDVAGHVEIRWSHGRFAQPPEAKVYLDTAHESVPGYVLLTAG